MTDFYQTLGVNRNASPDEIKRAYRKLAAQHHPDKGGDTSKFQEISAAYETLSNPDKKAQYDNPQPQFNGNPFGGFGGGGFPPGFEDIFAHFGGGGNTFFGAGFRQQQQRNQTLNIQTSITLEEAFHGKDIIANLQLPSGRDQVLELKIPAGIQDGMTLRLAGMGDDRVPNAPRGDIHLTVSVYPHHKFTRQDDDLSTNVEINSIEAMLGKTVEIQTIDNKILELKIPPGTQYKQVLSAPGYGMPKVNDSRFRGRLLILVIINTPLLNEDQKTILRQINI